MTVGSSDKKRERGDDCGSRFFERSSSFLCHVSISRYSFSRGKCDHLQSVYSLVLCHCGIQGCVLERDVDLGGGGFEISFNYSMWSDIRF